MRYFRLFISVFLLVLFVQPAKAQDYLTIAGKVVDGYKSVSLPFAAISIANSTIGTVTNEEGQFRMNIPLDHKNDSLFVAYLGYQTFKIALSGFSGSPVTIGLQPKPIQLSEVEIIGLTPREVIRRAVKNIPSNYGRDSLLLTVFIRVQKMANYQLAEYTEAIIEDMKDGYYLYKANEVEEKFRRSNYPHLYKGRVVSDTSLVNALADIGKDASCLSCNFKEDMVEFYHKTILDEKENINYDFSMLEQTMPEGGKLYRISFDQKEKLNELGWKGEIIIEASRYAILQISVKPSLKAFDYYEKTKYRHTFFVMGTQGWIKEMPMGETHVSYSKRGEYWALNSIRNDYWIIYSNPQTGARFKTRYKNDVVVTDVTRDKRKIRNFKGDKSLGIGQRWDQIVGKPDPEFWAEFNYLPIEEKLQQELSTINH
jgi:hypothetical protein